MSRAVEMMLKSIALVAIAFFVASLAACGGGEDLEPAADEPQRPAICGPDGRSCI